jgi:hypothetical protein
MTNILTLVTALSKHDLLNSKLNVINVGLDIFFQSLRDQMVNTVQVDWKPMTKLDKETEAILSKVL